MKKFSKVLLSLAAVCALLAPSFIVPAAAEETGNHYPVVLVHGNAGWGRDEMLGNFYWGGDVDIQEELKNAGYEVYTGVVGPFSSNWDRACELYAYIKGGTVDYGKAHSEQYGHDRYGRTFPGLYTSWGTEEAEGINKIHILGHSQGGQTSRLLVELLEDGMQSEIEAILGSSPTQAQIDEAVANGTLSKLFTGTCNDWVESVSTFATPHDGTTFANTVNTTGDLVTFFATSLGGMTAISSEINYYDLKLDQWGLYKNSNESFFCYFVRVLGSDLWLGTTDFSNYDLSTKGAQEMNEWVEDHPNVYYFSYSCEATQRIPFSSYHMPDAPYMNPLFYTTTFVMGSYENRWEGIDSKWFPNDGIVNTISENGPKTGRSTVNIVPYDGTPETGKWNDMGVLGTTDHEDIIGRDTSDEMGDLTSFYINYVEMLQDL